MLLLSVAAMAQAALTVGPSQLHVGDKALISYSDPTRAGQTITVNINSGGIGLEPIVVQLTLHLDQSGKASTAWLVPDWFLANFSGPGTNTISRGIL
jgi:hypothetical protein